jgi:hypothetical protein
MALQTASKGSTITAGTHQHTPCSSEEWAQGINASVSIALQSFESSLNVCQVSASCSQFFVVCHLACSPANRFRLLMVQLSDDDFELSFKGFHSLGKVWIPLYFFVFYCCYLRVRACKTIKHAN